MKTLNFITVVLIGTICEFFLKLVFPGYTIIIVPEILIYLTVINLESSDIFTKFIVSVLIYDLLIGERLGVVTLVMLVLFIIIYFSSEISYFGEKKMRNRKSVGFIVPSLFSGVLFLIYYIGTHYLDRVFLKLQASQFIWSWQWPGLTELFQALLIAMIIFLILYSNILLNRRRRVKW